MENTPCPDRIIDDLGSAFAMGAIGGSVWHSIKGWKNSPKGDRLRGSFQAITLRAPTLGGNFAVWGGLYASFDCLLSHFRRKEDPWNSIGAGAATGGTLAARAGLKAAGKNAIIGGALLGLIEGIGMLTQRMAPAPEAPSLGLPPPQAAGGPPGPQGGFGGPPPPKSDAGGSQFVFKDDDFGDLDSGAGSDSDHIDFTTDFGSYSSNDEFEIDYGNSQEFESEDDW